MLELSEHRQPPAGSKPPLIAVVDDDAAIRQLLHDILTGEGYETILLAEAAPALGMLRQTRPDLIILDLWMEQADAGWNIFDALRRDLTTRYLPVIVCSGNAFMLGTLATLRAAPHYVFLAKPFSVADVLAKVEALLTAPRQLPPRALRR